jgi:hypothetical protein
MIFDVTQSYDQYQFVLGLILLVSAAICFSVDIKKLSARPSEPVAVAASPSSA